MIDDRRRMVELMGNISELKEEYGAALILNYQGYSHQQIGDVLGCSAEAARKLVSRARAKLTAARSTSVECAPPQSCLNCWQLVDNSTDCRQPEWSGYDFLTVVCTIRPAYLVSLAFSAI